MNVTSRPADGTDTFKAGEQVEITITFDEPVEVQNAGVDGADVHIEVSVGPVPSGGFLQRDADFLRQDHPSQLIFAFEVLSGLVDGNGFCIGEICDRDNIVLDGTAAIVATLGWRHREHGLRREAHVMEDRPGYRGSDRRGVRPPACGA